MDKNIILQHLGLARGSLFNLNIKGGDAMLMADAISHIARVEQLLMAPDEEGSIEEPKEEEAEDATDKEC